jgi:hypothetical protein
LGHKHTAHENGESRFHIKFLEKDRSPAKKKFPENFGGSKENPGNIFFRACEKFPEFFSGKSVHALTC